MRKLAIIGASGHGKVVADMREKLEYKKIFLMMTRVSANVAVILSLEKVLMQRR